MTTNDITAMWAETWADTVRYTEERTGVPADQWRVGGRGKSEDLAWWQNAGLKQVEQYIEWYRKSGWKIATLPDGKPGIEWEAEVHFGGAPVRLVVDAVYDNGSDLIVVDYKTGSKTPFGVLQLSLYASAIERAYGVRPQWGAFYMTRKGILDELVDLSHWGMDYFDYVFEAMNKQMELGYYPPSVGDHCRYCSFSPHCIAVKGEKSADFPLHTQQKKEGK